MSVRHRQSGFTLVEVAIVAAIAGILLIGMAMMVRSTNEAYTTVSEDTDANFSLRQALNRISDEMRQSNTSVVQITSGTDYDSIDLQVPVSYAGSTVSWGAAGTAGWHIRYLVEDGWLIRRIVDGTGTVKQTDQVLARNVDVLFGGQKGFSVTASGGLYQITVRVTAQRGARVWRRMETTSVTTRNS
jgi:prepilin-type N-terminal cleavage/methylation domain-containing protein